MSLAAEYIVLGASTLWTFLIKVMYTSGIQFWRHFKKFLVTYNRYVLVFEVKDLQDFL